MGLRVLRLSVSGLGLFYKAPFSRRLRACRFGAQRFGVFFLDLGRNAQARGQRNPGFNREADTRLQLRV